MKALHRCAVTVPREAKPERECPDSRGSCWSIDHATIDKFATNSIAVAAVQLFCSLVVLLCSASADDRPNFLVIIADDMGFSDAGCYGGEIATPNLDALAAGGLRFTQFYNTTRCWPTRAALITGYYPQQIRRDGMPGAPRSFGGRGKRHEWAQTIAEYLRPAGYRNYHSGKWHPDEFPRQSVGTSVDLVFLDKRVIYIELL